MAKITVLRSDITTLSVDAIVNAANNTLLGGGGVDGAIHRAAGSELLEYCLKLGGCPTGEARLTPGFKLPARHVIHTVGPIWQGGNDGEAQLLANCYHNSLALAVEHTLADIAFPAISTGVYGFPKAAACNIAVASVAGWEAALPQHVVFVSFDSETFDLYTRQLDSLNTGAER